MGPRRVGAEVSRGRDGLGLKSPVAMYVSLF